MPFTAEELKEFLAPETYQCKMCKKKLNTEYEARLCEHNDRIAKQKADQELAEQKEKAEKNAKKLKEVLEANLT